MEVKMKKNKKPAPESGTGLPNGTNNNNTCKNTPITIFPVDFEKCFLSIESEFQTFERKFLQYQLKKRTSLKMANIQSVNPVGIEFLIFFTGAIEFDLNIFGQTLCKVINAKLKKVKVKQYNCMLSDQEKLELDYYISKIIR